MTTRKTAKEISDAIITQLETSLNTTIPLFPRAFNRVLAKALGGIFVILYEFAGFILLQMFVKTASNDPVNVGGIEITPLKLWGSLVNIFQKDGQRTELTVDIDVITQGGTLSSGERIVNTDTQVVYTLISDVALSAASVQGQFRATVLGEIGNVDAGTVLSFVSAPPEVEKDVTVDTRDLDGVDPEETEAFRDRVLGRYAAVPQGGAYADYRLWAEEVEGVKNAYPYSGWSFVETFPSGGPGFVFVFVESDTGDGIPSPTLLAEVLANIELNEAGLATRRNINAKVETKPITRTTFDITIQGFVVENQTEGEADAEAALTDFFLDREPYITGVSVPPRKDFVTEMNVGGVVAQIAEANGGSVESITIDSPVTVEGIYPLQEGEKAKLGTITWI